jgi:hypothetical protein
MQQVGAGKLARTKSEDLDVGTAKNFVMDGVKMERQFLKMDEEPPEEAKGGKPGASASGAVGGAPLQDFAQAVSDTMGPNLDRAIEDGVEGGEEFGPPPPGLESEPPAASPEPPSDQPATPPEPGP